MARSSGEGVPQEFRGLRGILRFNWHKFHSLSIGQRMFVAVIFFAWVSVLTFVWLEAPRKAADFLP